MPIEDGSAYGYMYCKKSYTTGLDAMRANTVDTYADLTLYAYSASGTNIATSVLSIQTVGDP